MDLYDEADKHLARFSEVIKELADANQLMDEDQLIDFIDDWSAAVYENAKDQWQVALNLQVQWRDEVSRSMGNRTRLS